MDPETRADFEFSVRMALRRVPREVWMRMVKRGSSGDELPETVAVGFVVEHLLASNWVVTRGPPAPATRSLTPVPPLP